MQLQAIETAPGLNPSVARMRPQIALDAFERLMAVAGLHVQVALQAGHANLAVAGVQACLAFTWHANLDLDSPATYAEDVCRMWKTHFNLDRIAVLTIHDLQSPLPKAPLLGRNAHL